MMDMSQGQAVQDEVAMLLARCAQADRDALRQLYVLEASRLHGLALRITRDDAMAADALHDTFEQVWRNARRFDPQRSNGRAWLTALLRYRAIDAARWRKRSRDLSDIAEVADDAPSPFENLVAEYDTRTLTRCLGTLDERRRRLVVLAYLNGLTHAQLAARVGEPLGTVKSAVRRALVALRACMDGRS